MKKPRMTNALRETLQFYGFVSPWIIGFACFTLIPLACSVVYSFYDFTKLDLALNNPMFFVGIDNYKAAFAAGTQLWTTIGNTFFYAIIRVGVGVLLSFLFALLLNRKIFARKVFRTLIYVPAIIPMVGSAIVWQALFDERFSLFNYLFGLIGLPSVDWLGNGAMGSVLLMSVWCGIGPTMIILLAALQTVPQDVIEAAHLDGAGPLRTTVRIVMPLVSSTFLYCLVTGFIGCLQAYAEFDLVTGGGPGIKTTTMTMLVIREMDSSLGAACALAWIVCIIVMIFTLLFFRLSNRMVFYAGGDD